MEISQIRVILEPHYLGGRTVELQITVTTQGRDFQFRTLIEDDDFDTRFDLYVQDAIKALKEEVKKQRAK